MSQFELPSREFTFLVDIKDSEGIHRYGDFTYSKPTLRVKSEIEKTVSRLSEGLELSEDMRIVHRVLATLRHTIVDFPKWWEEKGFGMEFDDTLVIFDIFTKIQDFEDDYQKRVYGSQEEVVEKSKRKRSESKSKEEQK